MLQFTHFMSTNDDTTADNNDATITRSSDENYTIKGMVKFANGEPANGIKIQA